MVPEGVALDFSVLQPAWRIEPVEQQLCNRPGYVTPFPRDALDNSILIVPSPRLDVVAVGAYRMGGLRWYVFVKNVLIGTSRNVC